MFNKKKWMRQWRLDNKERNNKLKREWYKKNRNKCISWSKRYKNNNKEKVLLKQKIYRDNNLEKNHTKRHEWYRKNKEYSHKYTQEYCKKRKKNNPRYKLIDTVRANFINILKGKSPGIKLPKLFGYSTLDLRNHFQNLFDSKMNWDNYCSYWVLDHRKPISLFKFNNINDEEFKKCWALKNIRPLERMENYKKTNKYDPL